MKCASVSVQKLLVNDSMIAMMTIVIDITAQREALNEIRVFQADRFIVTTEL